MSGRYRCFECGRPSSHAHHVVPKVLGGTRTVPLCRVCHSLIHDIKLTKGMSLQRMGIEIAKKRGVYKGRKPGTFKARPALARELRALGNAPAEIMRAMGISRATLTRYLRAPSA